MSFVDFCAQREIIHETIAPYSPQSNGVAERKNRTLKKMINVMLISSGLSQNMWGEAILSANYLLNKVPKKKAEKTPYELWKGIKPSYNSLRSCHIENSKNKNYDVLEQESLPFIGIKVRPSTFSKPNVWKT